MPRLIRRPSPFDPQSLSSPEAPVPAKASLLLLARDSSPSCCNDPVLPPARTTREVAPAPLHRSGWVERGWLLGSTCKTEHDARVVRRLCAFLPCGGELVV
jgi:hypothetical protein